MHGWLARFLVSLLSLVLSVGLLETLAIARLVDYRVAFGTIPPEPWQQPSNRLDPELLHLRKPNLVLKGEQRGGDIALYYDVPDPVTYPYSARYNADGFRLVGEQSPRPEVAVVGDSFIEALLTPDSDLVTSRMQEILGVPVANFGQLWFGPQQQARVIERFVIPMRPKVVVWVVFEGNDFTDIARFESLHRDLAALQRQLDSRWRRSFTRNALLAVKNLLKEQRAKPAPIAARCSAGDSRETTLYFYEDHRGDDPGTMKAVDTSVEIIRATAKLLAEQQISLVVAYAPSKIRVYRPLCDFGASGYPQEIREEQWQRFRIGLSREPAVRLIDLTAALRVASRNVGPSYFIDDTHWNSLGHSVVAEELARVVRDQVGEP